MILQYKLNEQLPKLAWIARTNRSKETIHVEHGKCVECNDHFLVEGVWDGDFKKGKFHKSYNFFGSGISVDGDTAYFVPSSAIVDRLMFCEHEKNIIVSNSLILLLAYTGAALDTDHEYIRESISILKGINKYDKNFKVNHPKIKCFKQLFSENLVVSKNRIFFEKRLKTTKISTYKQYYDFLKKILSLISENYTDVNRKTEIDSFTTISRGYDSTAVSSLVKDFGVKISFTGKKTINIDPLTRLKRLFIPNTVDDDGSLAAEALRLKVNYLDTKLSNVTEDELYFLSTNYPKFASIKMEGFQLDDHQIPRINHWAELSHHSLAHFIENNCSAALVFTGYHGDKIWEKNVDNKYLINDIVRGDLSGLNLTEIRLKSGFINVAVPFILAVNIEDINRISHSDEMKPWSLNLNDYDRPIPRRIAEDAGVSRNTFGIDKLYLAQNYYYPVNKKLRKMFFIFLKKNYGISRSFLFIYLIVNFYIPEIFHYFLYKTRLDKGKRYSFKFWKNYDFYFLMNHWATQILSRKYRDQLHDKYKLPEE